MFGGLKKLTSRTRNTHRGARRAHARLRLWHLEDRAVPAAFTVNALTDTGAGSGSAGDLRYCLTQANATIGADTINFDPTVFASAKTITLGGAELPVTDSVTVNGPAPPWRRSTPTRPAACSTSAARDS